ncbi:PP2C family protein-serine/threonine phosphatase [Xanthomonas vasicola]|uniref:PP2C family protein-serine/threonine phosphatase n=1 Tax=Xanthomonas vasicola TaxID=56459 RepID=UPI0001CC0B63|nr:PP2C family serine/threonine-protein phosphatase [Xanthomonas vasicola]AZR30957.1 serine/threonine-protein phosphatase [Xanthomonas vasicola pv. musacearum NCPPB 4379]KFA05531.1 phosphoprotein phosphatase [Xanthomonas vasicola pv. musacearum NCPPB 4380]KFA06820.1 phosphoprotein phosphatase [Xanthomonas vasicola pv. musacearum NCPPB 2005]KFA16764.1 phosphoprotein phosphatase [Xanthomonas vasicola pv. musacearum NCPPB 4392]MBV6744168.1 serine/threonine-protein phosphatase [Xanthomonas vasicol
MSASYVSAGRTEQGNVRRQNEDAILLRDDLGLWAVADGLGGHSAGDLASRMVVDALGGLRRDGDLASFVDAIDAQLSQVNQQLRTLARARRVDVIASTVVVLVHDHDMLMCGWVGDSRAYAFEEGRLQLLNRDHVAGDKDDLTQVGRAQHAGGALTRAIGADDALYVDWTVCARRPGQHFLLCSDGINKELSDDEIATHCRRERQPSALLARLFDTALSRAGRDNISAVALRLAARKTAL